VTFFSEYDYTPRGRAAAGGPFAVTPLAGFDVVDDSRAVSGPSAWAFDAASHAVKQTSVIVGPVSPPPAGNGPDRPGTYRVGKEATWPPMRDLVLHCRLQSSAPGGIGVVFRFQDADNFYFFMMDAARSYRRLGKKVAGVFKELDVPATEVTQGFTTGGEHVVIIGSVQEAFVVMLDGEQILSGEDHSIGEPGRVGLYAYDCSTAQFLELTVRPA
jgi:hypothetical protein